MTRKRIGSDLDMAIVGTYASRLCIARREGEM